MTNLTLLGSPLSPFVRKVAIVPGEKGIKHRLEPVNPFDPPDGFAQISPLGKVPVLQHGEFTLSDSSAICAYLNAEYPRPPIYPDSPRDLGHALWIEELADTDLGLAVGSIFVNDVIRPLFLREDVAADELDHAVQVTVPHWFDYLERELDHQGFSLGCPFTIADAAIVSQFLAYSHCHSAKPLGGWPRLANYFEQSLRRTTIQYIQARETQLIQTASTRCENDSQRLSADGGRH